MTFLEAIEAIEAKVSKLRMKYRDGELMEPIVALGRIGKFHGTRYDFLLEITGKGLVTPDHYYLEMIKMIFEYTARERKCD